MATKKTNTNKETTTKKTTAKKEDTVKKTAAKKMAEDTVKKTAAKKTTEDTVKKTAEDTVKKTAAKKTAEDTVKKTAAKKTAEDTVKKTAAKKTAEDTVKKTATKKTAEDTVKKTAAEVKKEEEPKAIDKSNKTTEVKTFTSIVKEDDKKEEKKDLKELLKSSQDRKISLKTSTPVRKIESIKTENNDSKPERESITLLKEAIKAKSKNVSRPVSVKKRILIDDDETISSNDNLPLNISKPVSSSLFNNEDIQKIDTENNNLESHIHSSSIINNENTQPYHFESLEEKKDEEKIENIETVYEEQKEDEIETKEETIDEKIEDIEIEEVVEQIDDKNEEDNEQKESYSVNEEIKEEVSINEEVSDDKDKSEEKVTYSKSDIFKRVVIPNLNENEEIQKSKFNQDEIDHAVKNTPVIDENEKIENYQNYTDEDTAEINNEKFQELREKDIKIIETEDELKTSTLPEIERKPVEPYIVPTHSMGNEKKQNKLVPIIGIIVIILGLSLLGVQFFSGKNNNNVDDDFYEIVTNEMPTTQTNNADTNTVRSQQTNNTAVDTQTNTARPQQTNNTAVNTQTNAARPQQTNNTAVNTQTNTARPQQTNNTTVNTQTNITPPTPPKEPEITPPTPPTPPPNPPTANNTNAMSAVQTTGSNPNNTSAYTSDANVYKTQWNDTLSSIATKELGDGRRWPSIFVLNQNVLNNPDSIVFNIYIKIPKGGKKKVDDMNDSEKKSLYNDYMKVAEIYSRIGKENFANTIKSQANSILK